MSAEDRDAHAGDGCAECGKVEDAAGFVLYFHFLFGVAGLCESIDLWDEVERDGVGEDVRWEGLIF